MLWNLHTSCGLWENYFEKRRAKKTILNSCFALDSKILNPLSERRTLNLQSNSPGKTNQQSGLMTGWLSGTTILSGVVFSPYHSVILSPFLDALERIRITVHRMLTLKTHVWLLVLFSRQKKNFWYHWPNLFYQCMTVLVARGPHDVFFNHSFARLNPTMKEYFYTLDKRKRLNSMSAGLFQPMHVKKAQKTPTTRRVLL